jgi:hypothetical protein
MNAIRPHEEEDMSAARGDRKPCTRMGCPGTMQFGREPLPARPTITTADGERGWVCSEKAEHFQLAAERSASELIESTAAHAGRFDDVGTRRR